MPDIFLLSEAVLSQMSSEEEQKYRVFAQLRFIKHRDCSFNVCFVCIYPLLFTSQKFWTKIPTLRHFKNRHSVSLILSDFQNSEGDKKDIFAIVRENFFPVLMKGTCRFVCRTN